MSRLIFIEECSSTQDEVVSILLSSPENFSAVCTFNQTAGRGQYGNSWNDTKEEGIAISFGFKKNQKSVSGSLFNFYTALILRDFLANMTQEVVYIKWPNDLILKGKKIAGMLIEKKKIGSEDFYIIGVGINMLQTEFDEISNAGSIFSQTGKIFKLEVFAEQLFLFVEEKLKLDLNSINILDEYETFLFKKNQVCVFEKDQIRQNGIIRHVDAAGYIWIELENEGLQKFFYKEISMLY